MIETVLNFRQGVCVNLVTNFDLMHQNTLAAKFKALCDHSDLISCISQPESLTLIS